MSWCRCTRLGDMLVLTFVWIALMVCRETHTVPVEDVERVDHHDGQCATSPRV